MGGGCAETGSGVGSATARLEKTARYCKHSVNNIEKHRKFPLKPPLPGAPYMEGKIFFVHFQKSLFNLRSRRVYKPLRLNPDK
jgi:hypothetical protein